MSESKEKNTILILRGNRSDFETILSLFQTGYLESLIGLPVAGVEEVVKGEAEQSGASLPIRLNQWFQKITATDWSREVVLLGTMLSYQTGEVQLSPTRDITISRAETLLSENQASSPNMARQLAFQTAMAMAEASYPKPKAIQMLAQALENREYDELYWQIALSLGALDPDHPQAAVAQRKEFTIGKTCFELLVALQRQTEARLSILMQLYSTEQYYLPSGLRLRVMDASKALLQQVRTTGQESYLSIELLKTIHETFTIAIQFQEESLEETFWV